MLCTKNNRNHNSKQKWKHQKEEKSLIIICPFFPKHKIQTMIIFNLQNKSKTLTSSQTSVLMHAHYTNSYLFNKLSFIILVNKLHEPEFL